jgi:hypothetical protein
MATCARDGLNLSREGARNGWFVAVNRLRLSPPLGAIPVAARNGGSTRRAEFMDKWGSTAFQGGRTVGAAEKK